MTPDRGLATTPATRPVAPLAIDRAGLEVLDRGACLALLATTHRGRVAITVGALPTILPVRFALESDEIVISAGVGTALDRATEGNVVAFQADGVDDASHDEWSVAVVGVARHMTDPKELQRAIELPLPRWIMAEPRQFISLPTERISGRRTFR